MTNGIQYTLKRHIPIHTYPLTNKYYTECHKEATRKEIAKYGLHRFHIVGIIVAQRPHELLGKNDPERHRYVSMIVPKMYREQVDYHERIEAECIARKKREAILKRKL